MLKMDSNLANLEATVKVG